MSRWRITFLANFVFLVVSKPQGQKFEKGYTKQFEGKFRVTESSETVRKKFESGAPRRISNFFRTVSELFCNSTSDRTFFELFPNFSVTRPRTELFLNFAFELFGNFSRTLAFCLVPPVCQEIHVTTLDLVRTRALRSEDVRTCTLDANALSFFLSC